MPTHADGDSRLVSAGEPATLARLGDGAKAAIVARLAAHPAVRAGLAAATAPGAMPATMLNELARRWPRLAQIRLRPAMAVGLQLGYSDGNWQVVDAHDRRHAEAYDLRGLIGIDWAALFADVELVAGLPSASTMDLHDAPPPRMSGEGELLLREADTPREPPHSPEFKAWFANSRVVDQQGRPLEVYHGTSRQFTVFKPSERGSFGAGIYFADLSAAEQYADGGAVMPVYLSLQRPLEVRADFEPGEYIDFDSAAVPLIEALFGAEAPAIIEAARKSEDDLFGDEVRQAALRLGYDGLILTYEGGAQEFVAYRPEQVKSSTLNLGTYDPKSADLMLRESDARGPAEEIRNWFRDSVAVAADGAPLTLYHATPEVFSAFSAEASRHMGIHLGTRTQALAIAKRSAGRVLKLHAAIRRPLRLPDLGTWGAQNVMREARRAGVAISESEYEAVFHAADTQAALRDLLGRKGFDGIVYRNEVEGPGDSYIAFSGEQVRSAEAVEEALRSHGSAIRLRESEAAPPPPKEGCSSLRSIDGEVAALRARQALSDDGSPASSVLTNARRNAEAKRELAERLALDANGLTASTRNGGSSLVSLDTHSDGNMWRITRFDRNGEPYGHTVYRTAAEAVFDLVSECAPPHAVARQTDTPAFRRWFSGSAVVDAAGEPLVVYHGTRQSGFHSFDPRRQNSSSRTGATGFYFTNSKLGALTYSGTQREATISSDPDFDARYDGEPGNYSVFLSMKRPLVVDFAGADWSAAPEDSGFGDQSINEIAEYAEAAEYDGVIALNLADEGQHGQGYHWGDTTYIVFRPEQIKSAVTNVGAFDPSSADIRLRQEKEDHRAAPRQTDSPAFARWFGASKAINDAGVPLVVYHGTNKDFDVFATSAGPRSKMVGDWGGVHFTSDREQAKAIADSLARREGGTPRVVEAYLRAENPVPFGKYRSQDQAEAAGHDARLTENNVGLQEWTVFRPEQIKSPDNRGTFDPTEPNIYLRTADGDEATGSSAFDHWFGDSKVVDADGKPRVVYHGTGKDFTEFNVENDYGGGAYFTPERDMALAFAQHKNDQDPSFNPTVVAAYLSLKNPLITDEQVLRSVAEELGHENPAKFLENFEDSNVEERRQVKAYAELRGHDGLILPRDLMPLGPDSDWIYIQTFVAFRPEQIKSAIGNNGQFDPTEPSILLRESDEHAATADSALARWLEGSKVVDESGEPLLVYHGTPRGGFAEFDRSRSGSNLYPRFGDGVYFTPDPAYADHYRRDEGGSERLAAYLNLRSPLEVTSVNQWRDVVFAERSRGTRYEQEQNAGLRDSEVLSSLGYDGVVYRHDGKVVEVVAFRPEQIKLVASDRVAVDPSQRSALDRAAGARDATATPAFKRWFGKSKVADSTGRALVMYHGTSRSFDYFDPQASGRSQYFGEGIYFTNDGRSASDYAAGDGANIVPSYLSLQNPFIEGESVFNGGRPLVATALRKDLIRQAYEAAGYDGVILRRGWAIAFRPEQVKSAIGNHGTFDPGEPSILLRARDLNARAHASAFRRWFGSSKVVDAAGSPLRMFHGSNADISQFRGRAGDGVYFSSNADYASGYGEIKAETFGGAASTYPVYLSIQNPLELRGDDDAHWERYTQRGFDVHALTSEGYDGIVMRYADGEVEAMAFRPEQIKSALGNGGAFDPSSADIRLRQGGDEGSSTSKDSPGECGYLDVDDLPQETKDDLAYAMQTRVEALRSMREEDIKSEIIGLADPVVVLSRRVTPASIHAKDRQTSASVVAQYSRLDGAGAPPILLDGDRLIEGGHRLAAAIKRGDKWISAIEVGPILRADWTNWTSGGAKLPSDPVRSNVRPPAAAGDQTKSEAFKHWFGDSQVVDSDGYPLVVFHGGGAGIEVFDKRRTADGGFYFTANKDDAREFAELRDRSGVSPVYLKIENNGFNRLNEIMRGAKVAYEQAYEILQAEGFDGVFTPDDPGTGELIAFRPEQIKSAVANRGTFDPSEPSILLRTADADDGTSETAFESWFGDSKVVDADGAPLVLYHGTAAEKDFSKFRCPAYFTSDPKAAQIFGEDRADIEFDEEACTEVALRSRVMPVYLSIKNPLAVRDFREFSEWDARRRTRAEKQGYDGLMIVMPDNGEQLWMAFRPEQIKSAFQVRQELGAGPRPGRPPSSEVDMVDPAQ